VQGGLWQLCCGVGGTSGASFPLRMAESCRTGASASPHITPSSFFPAIATPPEAPTTDDPDTGQRIWGCTRRCSPA